MYGLDNNFYYAHARSVAFDFDLDIRNEIAQVPQLATAETGDVFAGIVGSWGPRQIRTSYAPGSGLLAVPFLLAARGADAVFLAPMLGRAPLDSTALLFIVSFSLAGITWGILAVYLSARTAAAITASEDGARRASLLFFAASPMLWYTIFGNTMAHTAAAFLCALTLLLWLKWDAALRGPGRCVALSVALGGAIALATMTRYNLAALVLLPASAAVLLRTAGARRRVLAALAVVAAAALIVSLPQFLIWKSATGHWVPSGYQGRALSPRCPHALDVLFSWRNGLFTWTPIAAMAVAGLVALAVRGFAGRVMLLLFVSQVAIYGSWEVWWLGHSFGMRGMMDIFPVFVVGLAATTPWFTGHLRVTARAAAVLLIVWNLHLIALYSSDSIVHGEPLNLRDTASLRAWPAFWRQELRKGLTPQKRFWPLVR